MEKKRYLSTLGVVASFIVVLAHVDNDIIISQSSQWLFFGNAIEHLVNSMVFCFFMISGATLLDYRERYDTATFFKKRLTKTVIPFVAWSLLGLLFCCIKGETLDLTFLGIVDGILSARYVGAYWFFLSLFQLYLVIPILAAINDKKRIYGYMLLLGIGLNYIYPMLAEWSGRGINASIGISFIGGNLIYLLLGYCLSHYDLNRPARIFLYVAGILSFIYMVCKKNLVALGQGESYGYFTAAFLYIVVSAALFCAFRYAGAKSENMPTKIVDFLANYTLGVYLVHEFFVKMFIPFFAPSLAIIPRCIIGSILVYALSVILIFIMRKIPILRRIVP